MSLATNKSEVAVAIPFEGAGFVSTNAQDAIIEAKQNAEGFPRAGIRATVNGTVSANQWIGPSELLPNTPLLVAPVNLKLNEVSWSNQTANVQFRIQFRTVSKTGTIFYTLTVTSPNTGYGYASGIDYQFNAGTALWAQYLDDGQNASDFDLILWVSRVP